MPVKGEPRLRFSLEYGAGPDGSRYRIVADYWENQWTHAVNGEWSYVQDPAILRFGKFWYIGFSTWFEGEDIVGKIFKLTPVPVQGPTVKR